MTLARADIADGDNNSPSPKHISDMMTYATSPDGLSPEDFAKYRVYLESGTPHDLLPGPIASALRCGGTFHSSPLCPKELFLSNTVHLD